MKAIAARLAEYVCRLTWEDLSADTVDMAKKCVFDSLSNMYNGRYTTMGERMLSYVKYRYPLADGERGFSLLGGGRASFEACLAAHAVMARCSDLDDGHRYAMGHPGSVIVPAALTAAEAAGRSMKEVLVAIVAGYDVYCRIGAAVNPNSYRERGFESTGTVGAVACAAVIGKLFGLGEEQMRNVLGIAGSFSGGLIEYQNDGTMGKVLCCMWAVRNGLEAVLLSRKGFTGPVEIFEGKKGFFQAFSNRPDASRVTDNLGVDFKIKETYFKVHACMRGLHATLDSLLDIRRRQKLSAEAVERIEVYATSFVGRLSNPAPATPIGAQNSLEFTMAVAMLEEGGDWEEALKNAVLTRDEVVYGMAARIHFSLDETIDRYIKENPSHWAAARVVIHTVSGETFSQWTALPRGEAENPLNWDERREKFRRLIRGTPYARREEQLYEQVLCLEKLEDIKELF